VNARGFSAGPKADEGVLTLVPEGIRLLQPTLLRQPGKRKTRSDAVRSGPSNLVS
jgi:hypothetical protein